MRMKLSTDEAGRRFPCRIGRQRKAGRLECHPSWKETVRRQDRVRNDEKQISSQKALGGEAVSVATLLGMTMNQEA
jgi:hypothetical protein